MVRRVRLLVGHWLVPLAHTDSGRAILAAERSRESARPPPPPPPPPPLPSRLPGPAPLHSPASGPDRAHLGADRGGVQGAPGTRQLSAPGQNLWEKRRETETTAPTPTRQAPRVAHSPVVPVPACTRAPPSWAGRSARDVEPRRGGKGQHWEAATGDETKAKPALEAGASE